MTCPQVFVETNFLFGVFRMPSERRPEALALKARFDAGEIELHIPYLCFQEARNLISKSLPRNRFADIREFHRFAATTGSVNWNYDEVHKLLDAATAEVNRTKAVHQREVADFVAALGDGVLHGTREVFDLVESLDLDGDTLKYNDKLILCSILHKAKQLRDPGAAVSYFASLDKSDLQPIPQRPKLTRYYSEAGLRFIPGFVLTDSAAGLV